MIWVLLALLVLFTCLYINDRRKNKKQPVVEKKPSYKWYAKKSCLIFFMTGKSFVIIQINQDELAFISNENTINDKKKKPLNVFSTDEIYYC